MFNKKTIRDIDLHGKRVLVRVDFNVPIDKGEIGDDTRIKAALPTINYLLDQKSKVILCSHLGRPEGQVDLKYSLYQIIPRLEELLGIPIKFANDCIGNDAIDISNSMLPGEVLLLENTRFYGGETKNDQNFSKNLASLADIFVNDAFGTAHRAHSSTVGVAKLLPSVAGFLMEKEIKFLGSAIASPERPFTAILGGAKVSDKIGVIKNLLSKADFILIGGGMANTFFKAQGYPVGDSLTEDDVLKQAKDFLIEGSTKIKLPVDVRIADAFNKNAINKVVPVGPIPTGWRILDIGPETVSSFKKTIKSSRTIVWNGPMGVFEFPEFAKGTFAIAKAIAESKSTSIIGGGESVSAIHQSGLMDKFTHISTGGGASLEMLEGLDLPGVSVLMDN